MTDNKSTKQRFWSDQVSNSISVHKDYWNRADRVQTIYREGQDFGIDGEGHRHQRLRHNNTTGDTGVNILYANTQVLSPAVLSRIPTPDIRKAVKDQEDKNPLTAGADQQELSGRLDVSRKTSEVLERYCGFMADKDKFQDSLYKTRDDYLIPGRGVIRFKYRAAFGFDEAEREENILRDENGNAMQDEHGEVVSESIFRNKRGEEVTPDEDAGDRLTETGADIKVKIGEEVIPEYVFYRDFIHAVDSKSTQFKKRTIRNWRDVWWVGFRHPMTQKEIETTFPTAKKVVAQLDSESTTFDVWEIWDRRSRKRIWLTENATDIFKEEEAPLNLSGFFPMPRPLEAVHTTDDILPVPLYITYQDQAAELNEVESRLAANTRMMKWSGMVDGSIPTNSWDIAALRDGQFLPTKTATDLREKGGLAGSVFSPPLRDIAAAIQALTVRRGQLIENIQQISGISDILRGFSDPRDGVGTQRLKGTFGTLRLRPLRQPMEEFIRDCYRIMTEIALDKFDDATFTEITNIEITEAMRRFIDNDAATEFLIDVETDATVLPNSELDQQEAVQFGQVITQVLGAAFQATQLAPESADFFGEAIKHIAQSFPVGRTLMDEIDNLTDALKQQGLIAQQMRVAQAASGDQQMQQAAQADQAKIVGRLREASLKAETQLQTAAIRLQEARERNQTSIATTQIRQEGQNRSEELDVVAAIASRG